MSGEPADKVGTSAPLVVAVVLTWNDTRMAGRCVRSVLENDYRPLRVVVVDNGSKTPCGEELQREFPEIETVVLPRNQGFTGGCNRGLERALAMGADYAFLLNNDTIVEPDVLRKLIDELEARPGAAAASALLISSGEEKRVLFHTGTIHRDCARHVHADVGAPLDAREWATVQSEFVPACALLFRASALREVGLFDESLGTCWEDYDLCVRFLDARKPLLAVGSARVVHDHGATTGKTSPYITYYFTRNRLICLARYGTPLGTLRCLPLLLRSFWWQVKDYGLDNWTCHRAFARGVYDFLARQRGELAVKRSRSDRPR